MDVKTECDKPKIIFPNVYTSKLSRIHYSKRDPKNLRKLVMAKQSQYLSKISERKLMKWRQAPIKNAISYLLGKPKNVAIK